MYNKVCFITESGSELVRQCRGVRSMMGKKRTIFGARAGWAGEAPLEAPAAHGCIPEPPRASHATQGCCAAAREALLVAAWPRHVRGELQRFAVWAIVRGRGRYPRTAKMTRNLVGLKYGRAPSVLRQQQLNIPHMPHHGASL